MVYCVARFIASSRIIWSADGGGRRVFRARFVTSRSFFSGATFFRAACNVLRFGPGSKGPLILLFFGADGLFPFEFLFKRTCFGSVQFISSRAYVLPRPGAFKG